MQEKRKDWQGKMEQICREKLIFLDESGVNTNLVRRYGRAVGKQRVVDSAPFSTPKTTTVLSAMRLDGQFACRMYEGGTTKDRFLEYLREDLVPSLREGDIVVMDNLRAHHTKGVEELLRSVGAVPLYLPPYSPDLNPIEKMWSKMKSILRKLRVRSAALLPDAVREALAAVSRSDCDGWFRCAGC